MHMCVFAFSFCSRLSLFCPCAQALQCMGIEVYPPGERPVHLCSRMHHPPVHGTATSGHQEQNSSKHRTLPGKPIDRYAVSKNSCEEPPVKSHSNPEGSVPQRSEERGRRGRPRQPGRCAPQGAHKCTHGHVQRGRAGAGEQVSEPLRVEARHLVHGGSVSSQAQGCMIR